MQGRRLGRLVAAVCGKGHDDGGVEEGDEEQR